MWAGMEVFRFPAGVLEVHGRAYFCYWEQYFGMGMVRETSEGTTKMKESRVFTPGLD